MKTMQDGAIVKFTMADWEEVLVTFNDFEWLLTQNPRACNYMTLKSSYIIYWLLPLSVTLNDIYHQIQFDAEYLGNDIR